MSDYQYNVLTFLGWPATILFGFLLHRSYRLRMALNEDYAKLKRRYLRLKRDAEIDPADWWKNN